MKKTKFLFYAFLLAFAMSCNEDEPIDIITEEGNISFDFYSHDISEIEEISTGIYTAFASGNPNTLEGRLRQFTLDLNEANPQWRFQENWPVGVDRDDFWWHIQWMAQYDYDPNQQIEHTEVTATAPSLLDGNTVYFHVYNDPARVWASDNGKEPAMFTALYRATATGNYPNQEWNMESIPVYYSDDTTFERGGPRAVDANIWKDSDNQLYMTFGSWDPEDQNVIVIAEMDENTGRIEGFDAQTPGYYPEGGLNAFHTVATFGEAAFSFHYDSYYYLFINLGSCCSGINSTYNIVVGRSQNIYGPYIDKQNRSFLDTYEDSFPGTTVLSGLLGETKYIGPGHSGIKEINGKLCFSFHYYDAESDGTPRLGTREIIFDEDGWPFIPSEEEFKFKE
jgi:arabinan endo-1,5-alpha-L-arabinosidase